MHRTWELLEKIVKKLIGGLFSSRQGPDAQVPLVYVFGWRQRPAAQPQSQDVEINGETLLPKGLQV